MERYGKLALGLDAWKSACKKGKNLLIEDRFAFLFFFFFCSWRDKGRDQFNFSLAGRRTDRRSGRIEVEGIERRIEPGSLATSVFVFHPEATFTNDAASSWYFQGIIENRIFPRIAVLLRGKMDIVRIFNIAYTEDFSLWISLQLRGLISLYGSLCSQPSENTFARGKNVVRFSSEIH